VGGGEKGGGGVCGRRKVECKEGHLTGFGGFSSRHGVPYRTRPIDRAEDGKKERKKRGGKGGKGEGAGPPDREQGGGVAALCPGRLLLVADRGKRGGRRGKRDARQATPSPHHGPAPATLSLSCCGPRLRGGG